ncbi:XrtA/PEP-CTERM system TPR-repeat protein PrsT [Kordiimonas gwangyangensis]|uniref:XrtA/PEP-CTERM system TPR-repeat protein PrsT n=2 Tax=Kordiimonas gwangyangensis TaxID=288022 RepID=UPI0009D94EC3|nr:XrtA/PEP-CTERM system TPR-repeat protein PrsT [Kordiimonas gwangyangensis]
MAGTSSRFHQRQTPRLRSVFAAALLACSFLTPVAHAQDKYGTVREMFAERRYDDAIKRLQELQDSSEADSQLYLLLARAYLETGAGIAAETAIERARRLGADYAGTATLFAKSLLLQGKYADALTSIRGVTLPAEDQVDAFIVAGDAHFALRNLKEARSSYERARERAPEQFLPYLGLARLELRSGNVPKAEELIKKAAELGPNSTMVAYTWGLVARYMGRPDEAQQHFLEARRLFPGNILANIELASIRIDEGALEEAEKYLDAVYAVAPSYPMALYLSGVIQASRGNFEEANSLLNRARNISDSYLPAIYIRGLVAYQLGQYSTAESLLKQVLRFSPQSQTVRMVLAGTYMRLSQSSAAYDVLRPLLDVPAPERSVLAMAAAAAMAAGEVERGHELYERLADQEKQSPDEVIDGLTSKLALSRYVTGDSSSAIDAILTQPQSEEVDVRELGILGNIQLRSGDVEGAMMTVSKILKALPQRALGYNMRGSIEYSQGQYEKARASFAEAIKRNPDYYTAIRNKGLAEMRLGLYADGEKTLKRLLSSQPTDARAKAALGRVLLLQGKGEEALTYFEEAIRVMPGSPEMETDYAKALAQAGRTSNAIEQAREAAVLAADRPELLKDLGLLLLDLDQAQLAVRPLSRYVAFNPNDGSAHLMHGRALLAMGLATGARISFERAEAAGTNAADARMVDWYLFAIDAISRKYADATRILPTLDPSKRPADVRASVVGDTLVAMGRTDEAIEAYKVAMRSGASSDLAVGLATAYESQGKGQTAIQTLEDYLKNTPTDRAARMKLGGLLEDAGLPAAATEQYEMVLRAGVADAHIVARLARAYLRLGNRKSVLLAERAYLIQPDDPFVLDIYGWVMLQAKRDLNAAETAIGKASRRAPSNALYRYHLGMTYLAQGRRMDALETLRQAVKLDPDFEEALDARRQIELLE